MPCWSLQDSDGSKGIRKALQKKLLSQNSEKEGVCFKQAGKGRTYMVEGTMQKDTSSTELKHKAGAWETLEGGTAEQVG